MGLRSYPGLVDMAKRASRRRSAGRYARAFYKALHEALAKEEKRTRSVGDKQALVHCIKNGINAAAAVLHEQFPSISPYRYQIPMEGFARGKAPDYAFTNGSRFYVIEQKSILRFNEFAEAFLQGLLAKKLGGEKVRYCTLFNYLHQPRVGFDKLCGLGDAVVVDHICILIPEPAYKDYSTEAVDGLFDDIVSWLR
jgi:hypothetical protein